MMDITFYKTLAMHFRKAFEDTDLSNASVFLKDFPDGYCSWATKFIGQFLLDEYELSPEHVNASSHPDYGTGGHEWIEVENIIIDITADQFNKYDLQLPKTIACDVTSSKWHKGWEHQERDSSSFNGFLKNDEFAKSSGKVKRTDIYNLVCEKVKKGLGGNSECYGE